MKKKVSLLIALFAIFMICHSQIVLPKVEKSSFTCWEINENYTPNGDFKKLFPNFLLDGKYVYPEEPFFESTKYPVDYIDTKESLNRFKRVIVKFLTPENALHQRDYDKISSKPVTFYLIDELNALQFNDGKTANERLKELLNNLLQKKRANSIIISDMDSYEFSGTTSLQFDDLVLQLSLDDMKLHEFNKEYKNLPSWLLYELSVQDIEGNVITKYKQAIFLDAHRKMSCGNSYYSFACVNAFANTYVTAMDCLINRFLNDTGIVAEIIEKNNKTRILQADDSTFRTLLKVKSDYNIIKAKKLQLAKECKKNQFTFSAIEDNVGQINKDKEQYNSWINSGNPILGIFGLIGAGDKGTSKEDIQRSSLMLAKLQERAAIINKEEESFFKNLNLSLTNLDMVNSMTNDRKNISQQLDLLLTKIATQKEKVILSASQMGTNNGQNILNYIKNNFSQLKPNEPLNSQSTASVESSAISNGGTDEGNDACSLNAQSELYKSSEYKNMMASKTNANISDYKAKMIELTLQYCGDKLSANEVQTLRQTAFNERQVARQLRATKGTPSFSSSDNVITQSTNTQQTSTNREQLQVMCPVCSGKKVVKCNTCAGSGKVKAKIKGWGTWTANEDFCPNCLGPGTNTCTNCNGTGTKKPKQNSDSKARIAN